MNSYKEPAPHITLYNDTTDPALVALEFSPQMGYRSVDRLMDELQNIREKLAIEIEKKGFMPFQIEEKLRLYPLLMSAELNINIEEVTTEVVKRFIDMPIAQEQIEDLLNRYIILFKLVTECNVSKVLNDSLFEEIIKLSFYAPREIAPLIEALELRRQLLIKIGK